MVGTTVANAAFGGALGLPGIPIVGALAGLAISFVTMVFAVSAPCRDGRLAIAGVAIATLGSVGCTYELLARTA